MASGSDETSAAPGDLELVRRFVNTLDVETGSDELASPTQATEWLRGQATPAEVGDRDLRQLHELREALRDLAGAQGTADRGEALNAVDAIASLHPVVVSLSTPAVLAPASRTGVDAFIERILGLVAGATLDGSWDRMKTCANDGCRWMYFDHSRNRSRTWCTMDLCGAQAKMRAFRSRHGPA
ncbi:MAG: CGNR zinc finger domain-containing protein [Actinomycetota bacterium]|nr:CGNR zinc finger domain-containing protein [Actinomycetota bacterium]